jgi:hypothetical protein
VSTLRDVVVEALEHLRVAAQRPADGVLGPEVAVADGAGQLLLELRVVEHRQMGGEDGGVLPAEFRLDGVAIPLDLAGGLGDRLGEALEFGVDGTASHEPARDAESLAVEDERLADRDAG